MSEKEEQDRTFTEEQQTMFETAEKNQNPEATRNRTPGMQIDPVIPGTGVAGSEENRDENASGEK